MFDHRNQDVKGLRDREIDDLLIDFERDLAALKEQEQALAARKQQLLTRQRRIEDLMTALREFYQDEKPAGPAAAVKTKTPAKKKPARKKTKLAAKIRPAKMPTKPASKAKPRTSSPPAAKTSPGMKAAIATSQAIADDAPKTVKVPLLDDKGAVKPQDWQRARDVIRDNQEWFRAFKRKLKKRPSTAQVLTAWDKQQADDEEALGELDEYHDRRKRTANKLSDLATGREPSLVTAADANLDADFDAEEIAAQKSLQQELARPPILPKQTTINAPNPGRSGSRRKANGRKREAAKS